MGFHLLLILALGWIWGFETDRQKKAHIFTDRRKYQVISRNFQKQFLYLSREME